MTATKQDIERWFEEAKKQGSAFLIIGHDWFDHDNYPIFCDDAKEVHENLKRIHDGNNRYDEVYDLSLPIAGQLAEHRAMHIPPEPNEE